MIAPIPIGDPDPIRNGGGYIFQNGTRTWIEWTYGFGRQLSTDEELFRVEVPDDVTAYLDGILSERGNWQKDTVELEGQRRGLPSCQIRRHTNTLLRSRGPKDRASVMTMVGNTIGWRALDREDEYPLVVKSAAVLKARWAALGVKP